MDTYMLPQEKPFLRLKEKLVIVINGKGGAGKDTVCEIAGRYLNVKIISAITPIKEIAAQFGWNGEKDSRSRRFLSDLKRTFVAYNDLPNRYLEEEYQKFKQSGEDVLFVHIREKDQIDAFQRRVDLKCVTMLVRTSRLGDGGKKYGNASDDNVEDYAYDYYYTNDQPLERLPADFMSFIWALFAAEGLLPDGAGENLPWLKNE